MNHEDWESLGRMLDRLVAGAMWTGITALVVGITLGLAIAGGLFR